MQNFAVGPALTSQAQHFLSYTSDFLRSSVLPYASALNPASPSILEMPSFLPAFQKKSLSKHCWVKLLTRTSSVQTHLRALTLMEYPLSSQGQPWSSVHQASRATGHLRGAAQPAADTASCTEVSPGRTA